MGIALGFLLGFRKNPLANSLTHSQLLLVSPFPIANSSTTGRCSCCRCLGRRILVHVPVMAFNVTHASLVLLLSVVVFLAQQQQLSF